MTAACLGSFATSLLGQRVLTLARPGRHVRRHAFDRQLTPPSRLMVGSLPAGLIY
jgi:hypothetical protein